MTNLNGLPALLTPGEVAKLFKVDAKTVTRWGQAGKLNSMRTPGGHRRFHIDDVAEALVRGGMDAAEVPQLLRQAGVGR